VKIKTVKISKFRAIDHLEINLKDLSLLIGNNGTGKTSIIEAINYCFSKSFLTSKIKYTDFYNGCNEPIKIEILFDGDFGVDVVDGYTTRQIPCNGVYLEIKKREKATAGKFLSDPFVITHYYTPNKPKDNDKGWEYKRGTNSIFKISERHLGVQQPVDSSYPVCVYLSKNRDRQLGKGFGSSMTDIIDDFNWKFARKIKEETEDGYKNFISNKKGYEDAIFERIDKETYKKIFKSLGDILEEYKIYDVGLSLFNANAPFSEAFISQKHSDLDLPISQLGSGMEMIVSLMFLDVLASQSNNKLLILIDEPELHLHPIYQEILIKYLISRSKDNQVVLSTHSPYFYKNCLDNQCIQLLVSKKESDLIKIEETQDGNFGLFPWSPSWGEINYYAYNLPTVEFHNELYGYIQSDILNTDNTTKTDEEFLKGGCQVNYPWIKQNNNNTTTNQCLTLMSYIRHYIHHPENRHNKKYTDKELKESIEWMIQFINQNNKKQNKTP